MTHVSNDGFEGYPGTVLATVTFQLTENNEFNVSFSAVTSKPTPINFTNHSYYNLAGHNAGHQELYNHFVTLNVDKYTVTEAQIATGEIRSVAGAPFDLRVRQNLGVALVNLPDVGFDNNYCITRGANQKLAFVAGKHFLIYNLGQCFNCPGISQTCRLICTTISSRKLPTKFSFNLCLNKPKIDGEETPEASAIRRILPQFLASQAKNLLILDLGLILAFPTIIIPALTGLNKQNNPNEFLHLTPVQASWLAGVLFICKPVGCAFSGMLSEPLGRKRAMFIVNIPLIFAWTMLYYVNTLEFVFIIFGILGFSVGLMEAPIITYVGEICEPSVRGVLIATSGIAATTGIFLVLLLGSMTSWRNTALICAIVPTVTMIAVCFVPESPLWLLSKNRKDDSLKALMWLRGWVSPSAVKQEFIELQRYRDKSTACNECEKTKLPCSHPPPKIVDRLRDLMRKRTLKPLFLVIAMFFFMHFCGIFAMRPYIVQILEAYGVPWNGNVSTVVLGVVGIVANVVLLTSVKFIGKRNIYLWSMIGTFISCFGLGYYSYRYLPSNWNSFKNHPPIPDDQISYFPIATFVIMQFCTSVGVSSVPNMIMSELFPFKSRAFASGLSVAVSEFIGFAATKTYYNLEMWLALPGVIILYGIIGVLGYIAMYFTLPETENCKLEEIELHFSDNSRKITDIHIRRNPVE